jgi:hypothetical protein
MNADVALMASYSATIDCFNRGTNKNNPVESCTTTFSASSSAAVTSTKNGQVLVPQQPVSAFTAPQVCPNPNLDAPDPAGALALNASPTRLPARASARPTSRSPPPTPDPAG